MAGILVGSTAAFFLSRFLGRPFVAAVIPPAQLERVEKLLESRSSRIVFFLLFLIPGVPKDILCYIAGLTPMSFLFFLGVSTVGRLPGIVGSSLIGGAARSSRWAGPAHPLCRRGPPVWSGAAAEAAGSRHSSKEWLPGGPPRKRKKSRWLRGRYRLS